jgi:poly-gamma-glutamate capsule biosynthesis protein CapA/YwtB (metallophosphatase superfamily)
MLVRSWSQVARPSFQALVARMRAADVTILNLETVIHAFEDYAQADSGGSWMASPPAIAAELAWAGVDLLSHANNHSFDYGPGGVLATHRHVEAAGLVVAGSGLDLQAASAPRRLACDGGSVTLVAAAATFVPYGRASESRLDMRGRPGINPLGLRKDTILHVPAGLPRLLRRAAGAIGVRIAKGERLQLERGLRPNRADLDANLAAIRTAAATAEVVVFSLHAHRHGRWLRKTAHRAVEAGAAVVLVHGLHRVLGVELYRGRVIFYGLGDFAYEPHHIERFPAESYRRNGLAFDADVAEVRAIMQHSVLAKKRETFEGCAAELSFVEGRLAGVRLLPLDLGFDLGPEERGRPELANGTLGGRIIGSMARQSARYRTRIVWDADRNQGLVETGG